MTPPFGVCYPFFLYVLSGLAPPYLADASKVGSNLSTCTAISNRFFENQPDEICSHYCEKASKRRFLKPEKLQDNSNEGKGKEQKKDQQGEGKEGKRKRNGCTLSLIIAALEKVFGRKKLLDARRSIW